MNFTKVNPTGGQIHITGISEEEWKSLVTILQVHVGNKGTMDTAKWMLQCMGEVPWAVANRIGVEDE